LSAELQPTFWRNILLSSSGLKCKRSKILAWSRQQAALLHATLLLALLFDIEDRWRQTWYVLSKCQLTFIRLQGIISQATKPCNIFYFWSWLGSCQAENSVLIRHST
jgi:hypothetical protein